MRVWLACLLCIWAGVAAAQSSDDDRDFLTGLIEDTVSNDSFTVRLENFEGALSAEATADAITLADADGVWLRLDDLVISWNRSALLSGRVEIETLTAERIELIRLPASRDDPALPTAAAEPFTFPQLPVAIDIADLRAAQIILTPDLLGEPVTARFEGRLSLGDGAGSTDILLERTDDKTGRFDVAAAYDTTSGQLTLSVLAEEGANGIAARLLDLRGRPSVRLAIAGDAPLAQFDADIALATDGIDRIAGHVTLSQPDDMADQNFAVDLSGDLRPLLPSDYSGFFGETSVLRLQGAALAAGGLRLSNLIVAADQVVLRGAAQFDAQGWPQTLDLRGRLGSGGAAPVVLPGSGPATQVGGMSLDVQYDQSNGAAWTGTFDITALRQGDIAVDALSLSGGGIITPGAGDAVGRFSAAFDYAARGLELADAALNTAVGSDINGRIDLGRSEGEAFIINGLTLNGAGLSAVANARVDGPDARFLTRAALSVRATDFSRFAPIAGLDLAGAGSIELDGQVQPFDGIFDISILSAANDLAFGIGQIDPLLAGQSRLSVQIDRDTTGTRITDFQIAARGISASGNAEITPDTTLATLNAALPDLGLVAPQLSGPALFAASVATDPQGVITLDTTLQAPSAQAAFDGTATPADEGYSLRGTGRADVGDLAVYAGLIGQPLGGAVSVTLEGLFATATGVLDAAITAQTQDLRAGSPALTPLLSGTGTISADVSLSEARRLQLDGLDVAFPNLTVRGNLASSGADTTANLNLRLRDIGLFAPEFSGPVTAEVIARQNATGWQVAGDARGPAGTAARASGRVSGAGVFDLAITGNAPLALANVYIAPRQISGQARFALTLDGPADLASLRGPITLSDARLSAPLLRQAIEDIGGTITLAGGTARLDLAGRSDAGGGLTLSGPVGLAAPFDAALAVRLDGIVLRDPELYQTTARGDVTLTGPLAGGAAIAGGIDLGAVEVQVPSTGVSALGSLPAVTHLGPRMDVRATLARAGVDVTPAPAPAPALARARAGGAGPVYPIDLLIRAPSRIFIRGRGLDAELGGQLRLTGTTRDIVPIGRFDLVRGRLAILGQRFDLDEGFAQLQGDFSPFLRLVATSETATGVLIRIIVEGPADAIDVRFESTPELPQDEVLAQLLFGRDLTSISPLQAVQLASAVATLAGAGGANGGVINNLRNTLDLDDLDFVTDDEGNAGVRAGKYISERVYTDVTLGSGGSSEINLNIDIDRNFTARGSVGSDGDTSLGIFFERDY